MEQIISVPKNILKSTDMNGINVSNVNLSGSDSMMEGLNITSFNQILAELIHGNLNLEVKEREVLISKFSDILQTSDEITNDLMNWFNELSNTEQLLVYQMLNNLSLSTVENSQFNQKINQNINQNGNQLIANILANIDSKNKSLHSNQNELQKLLPLLKSHSDEIKTFLEFAQKELVKNNTIQNLQLEEIKSNKDAGMIIDNRTINLQNIFSINNFHAFNEVSATDNLTQDFEVKTLDLNQLQLNFNNVSNDNNVESKINPNQNLQNLLVDENFTNEFGKIIIKNLKLPNGESETKIQLQPSELGKVNVKLTAIDGHMTAQIITETVMGKELLESQIHQLKQSLTLLGYQVEKIEVQQASPSSSSNHQYASSGFDFSGQHPFQQQQREQSLNYSNNYLDEEEEITNYFYNASGIDYTA